MKRISKKPVVHPSGFASVWNSGRRKAWVCELCGVDCYKASYRNGIVTCLDCDDAHTKKQREILEYWEK